VLLPLLLVVGLVVVAVVVVRNRSQSEDLSVPGHAQAPRKSWLGSQVLPQSGKGGRDGTNSFLANSEWLKGLVTPKIELPPLVPTKTKKAPPSTLEPAEPAIKRPIRDPAAEEHLYGQALKTAQQALANEDFDGAVTWFGIALQIRTTDEALQGLRLAEQRRLVALAQAQALKEKRAREQKLALYTKFMRRGQLSRHLREYEPALTSFGEALKVFPEDVNALEAIAQTKEERDRWAVVLQRKAERAQLDAERSQEARLKREYHEYREAMSTGWQAMRQGKEQLALRSFGQALSLRPQDEDAQDGWTSAVRLRDYKRLLEEWRAEQQRLRDQEERARKEELVREQSYKKFMQAGTEAFGRRRYQEAMGSFLQALELWPDDPDAKEGWRTAREARDKAREAQEAREREQAEERAQRAAVAAKKLEQFRAEQSLIQKQQEAYLRAASIRQFLLDSELALANGRYSDAMTLLDRVGTMQPGHPALANLRQQAQEGQQRWLEARQKAKEVAEARAKVVAEAARKKLEQAQRLREEQEARLERQRRAQAYERLFKEGKQALDGRSYDAAVDLLNAAKRLNGKDPALAAMIDKAEQQREKDRQAREAAKAKRDQELADAEREARRRKEEAARLQEERRLREEKTRKARAYERFLTDGRLALSKGEVGKALTLFGQARNLRPDDPELANLIQQGQRRQEEERARRAEVEKRLAQERAVRLAKLRAEREEREREERQRTAAARAKRRAENYLLAMKQGSEALGRKQYLVAIAAYNEALTLQPGDDPASNGLRQAREAHEQLQAEARLKAQKQQEEFERKREQARARRLAEEFDQFLTYGRTAMAKNRFESAIHAFSEALKRKPGDEKTLAYLTEAQQGLAKANEEVAAAEQRRQEQRAALEAQQKALAQARAEARAKAAAPKPKPVPIDHRRKLLAMTRAAIELGRLEAASAALGALKKLVPEDEALPRLEQDLDLTHKIMKADRETARKLERQKALDAFPLSATEQQDLREAKVALHLESGRAQLAAGRQPEAAREFEAILRMVPDHAEATAGLKKARGE
jgi:tetratricopeptide (TPR) repeat protein